MDNGYITLKMPVKMVNTVYSPLYDLPDYKIPNMFFKRHYQQRYYSKGLLHYFWDKLLLKHPQPFRFWVEVTVKRTEETAEVIEEIVKKEEVEEIATPEAYKF